VTNSKLGCFSVEIRALAWHNQSSWRQQAAGDRRRESGDSGKTGNKIPLNPTLFAEYKFGIGPLNEIAELGSQPKEEKSGDQGPKRTPDAFEARLLLAEDFCDKVEWAFNLFLEQEVGGDRGRNGVSPRVWPCRCLGSAKSSNADSSSSIGTTPITENGGIRTSNFKSVLV
jgi:hypothetical protein